MLVLTHIIPNYWKDSFSDLCKDTAKSVWSEARPWIRTENATTQGLIDQVGDMMKHFEFMFRFERWINKSNNYNYKFNGIYRNRKQQKHDKQHFKF